MYKEKSRNKTRSNRLKLSCFSNSQLILKNTNTPIIHLDSSYQKNANPAVISFLIMSVPNKPISPVDIELIAGLIITILVMGICDWCVSIKILSISAGLGILQF